MKYFVASRWRNRAILDPLVEKIRSRGHDVYYFVEKTITAVGRDLEPEQYMQQYEAAQDWRNDPHYIEIFKQDLDGLKNADVLVMVLPAGNSSHMEAGIAFGLGKKCVLVGTIEKAESLYFTFDETYPDTDSFVASLS
jgi:hypothetical protein